jgi:hypothetical protein
MTPADLAPYYSEKLFILPVPFYVTSYKADAQRQEQLMAASQTDKSFARSASDHMSVAPVKYPTIAGDRGEGRCNGLGSVVVRAW